MSQSKRRLNAGEKKIRNALLASLLAVLLLAAAVFALLTWRQSPKAGGTPVAQTIPELPETLSADHQPPLPAIPFTDVTAAAGIHFTHVNGAYGERLMPETMGSGLAFLDYDRDGDQDLLLISSNYWPDHPGSPKPHPSLYANDGQGHFSDVSQQAGLDFSDYGMGVAVGDYDGDGWDDIYLTNLGPNRLLHNQAGHFVEVTGQAGVAGGASAWSTGAAFIDYDRDGDLDLFVTNYVKWSRNDDLEIDFRLTGLGRAYGAPNHFHGTDDRLFRNEGDGRFRDVSREAGIPVHDPESGLPLGKGLGVSPVDYDQDGWIDLVVANDTVRNFLYHNLGNGRFEEVGAFEGLAFDRNGKATGAMGIDSAHFRNDRELGIAIGNFANEMSSLFVTADGRPPFADEAMLEGLGPASRQALTFGVFFFDADLDGRLDLFQANGHLEHEINRVQKSQHYAQPAQLFWNCGEACANRFRLVEGAGDLSRPLVGRGAAYADIDGDGDLDIAINQNGRPARLLRNDQRLGHHWLRLRLIGGGRNPDAIGARLALTQGGVTQYRRVMPTRGYLSQVELPVTFGLSDRSEPARLEITWPDGGQQTLRVDRFDRLLEIHREDGK